MTGLEALVQWAHNQRASEFFLSAQKDTGSIHLKIDGLLRPAAYVTLSEYNRIFDSVLQVPCASHMTGSWQQEGSSFFHTEAGEDLDIRDVTFPTKHGRDAHVRILNRATAPIGVKNMGLRGAPLEAVLNLLRRRCGLILLGGGRGSGMTTLLYSLMQCIQPTGVRILSLEDRIDYELQGIKQIHVIYDAGDTYAGVLCNTVSWDPAVIAIDATPEQDTAVTCCKLALEDRLVLAVRRDPGAASAATSLLGMGIEPELFLTAWKGAITQRTVRRICEGCKQPINHRDGMLKDYGFTSCDSARTFYRSVGCERCDGTGYRGQIGVFEVVTVDESLRQEILKAHKRPDFEALLDHASGFHSMESDARSKIAGGITTVEEVARRGIITLPANF